MEMSLMMTPALVRFWPGPITEPFLPKDAALSSATRQMLR
jgi:hypothetical protein